MEFVMQFVCEHISRWNILGQKSFWTHCQSPDEVKILQAKLSGWTNSDVIELNVGFNGQLFSEGWLHIDMKTSEIFHFLLAAQIRTECISYKYDWFILSFRISFDIHWLFFHKLILFWNKSVNALIECARICFHLR